MKRLIAVFVVVFLVGTVIGPSIASAGKGNGHGEPAPKSGDCVPDGSGFDTPNGPNGNGSDSAKGHVGPAPNSGDGNPDGSGWEE